MTVGVIVKNADDTGHTRSQDLPGQATRPNQQNIGHLTARPRLATQR